MTDENNVLPPSALARAENDAGADISGDVLRKLR